MRRQSLKTPRSDASVSTKAATPDDLLQVLSAKGSAGATRAELGIALNRCSKTIGGLLRRLVNDGSIYVNKSDNRHGCVARYVDAHFLLDFLERMDEIDPSGTGQFKHTIVNAADVRMDKIAVPSFIFSFGRKPLRIPLKG